MEGPVVLANRGQVLSGPHQWAIYCVTDQNLGVYLSVAVWCVCVRGPTSGWCMARACYMATSRRFRLL